MVWQLSSSLCRFSLLPVWLAAETDCDSVSFAVHDRRDSHFEGKKRQSYPYIPVDGYWNILTVLGV